MKKIISILMCFLLLASTSGVAYAQHFCGGNEMMATLTLGEEQLSCGMSTNVNDACKDEKAKDHSCCNNQYAKVTTDDSFHASQDTFQLAPSFVAAFVSVFVLQSDTIEEHKTTSFSVYHPPPLIKDIPVLYETFLI